MSFHCLLQMMVPWSSGAENISSIVFLISEIIMFIFASREPGFPELNWRKWDPILIWLSGEITSVLRS